jgi:hypothetical protein
MALPPPPPANGLAAIFGGFWSSWVLPEFGQQAFWLQRINSTMDGATPTPAWDAKRSIVTSFQDGSFGVGWKLGTRMGYLLPQTISCARNDNYKQEEVTDAGLIVYQGPALLFMPDIPLQKFDVLVFWDKRYVVGDALTPAQVMGQNVIIGAKLEEHSLDSIIYSIPLS